MEFFLSKIIEDFKYKKSTRIKALNFLEKYVGFKKGF